MKDSTLKIKTFITVSQVCVMLFLLCITLMNVEIRWSNSDIVLAYSIPFLVMVGVIVLLLNNDVWQFSSIDYIAGGWLFYWILRVWIGAEYPCATAFIQVAWMSLLYIALRLLFSSFDNKLLPFFAQLILLFGTIESIWGFWQIANGTSRHPLFPITGNFLNPGPYSAYPMMGFISGLILLNMKNSCLGFTFPNTGITDKEEGEKRKEILKTMIEGQTIICLMILPFTWSRAAWACIGLIALWIIRKTYWKWRWYVWGGLLVLSILAFLWKQGSAEGRIITWASALNTWWQKPFLGVGFGGFNHACGEGIASLYKNEPNLFSNFRNAGVTEFSYNTPLQILVEQGVIGEFFYITLVITALVKARQIYSPLLYLLFSLIIFSLFSYPFEMLPYRILLTILVAIIATKSAKGRYVRKIWWHPIVLVSITFVFSIFLLKETLNRKESEEGYSIISEQRDVFFLKDYWELLPDERDNSYFLFDMAKRLHRRGRYQDSNAILKQGILISRDPIFFTMMGNNYKSMGMTNKADSAYIQAYHHLPNMIYPLYLRMLLQQEQGNMVLAQSLAQQIVTMNPKIKSPATDEMQKNAREILINTDK